jgi:hypothetical protein
MTMKYTKWPQTIPNGNKIYQMPTKYTNLLNYKSLQNLPKLWFLVVSGNPGRRARLDLMTPWPDF